MHVGVHVLRFVAVPRTPDRLQDHLVGARASGVAREEPQEVELLRGELDLRSILVYFVVHEVEVQGPQGQLGRRDGGLRGSSPQDRADSRLEFAHGEGFGHVVVRAPVERLDLSVLGPGRREDDDRHVTPLADPLGDDESVHVGQPNVEHHDVGGLDGDLGDAVLAVDRGEHLMATSLESESQGAQ